VKPASRAWLLYAVTIALGAAILTPPLFWLGRYGVRTQLLPALAPFALPVYFRRTALVLGIVLWPLLWPRLALQPPSLRLETWRIDARAFRQGAYVGIGGVLLLTLVLMANHTLMLHRPLHTIAWHFVGARALMTGIAVAAVEEPLFRGAMLTSLRRERGALGALVMTSTVFALVHFIAVPPHGPVNEHAPWHAGFDLLAEATALWREPRAILGLGCTLWVMGMVLGHVTLQSGRLACALGLHAGWVMALLLVTAVTSPTGAPTWLLGADLRTGFAPLGVMAITWLTCATPLWRRSSLSP
jgi:membrane protease YdiL (CAAX protease family)